MSNRSEQDAVNMQQTIESFLSQAFQTPQSTNFFDLKISPLKTCAAQSFTQRRIPETLAKMAPQGKKLEQSAMETE